MTREEFNAKVESILANHVAEKEVIDKDSLLTIVQHYYKDTFKDTVIISRCVWANNVQSSVTVYLLPYADRLYRADEDEIIAL